MSDFKKLTAYKPCGVEYVSVSGTSDVDRLKAENAKLREALRDTWELLTCNEPRFVWVGMCDTMRELGIEVPE